MKLPTIHLNGTSKETLQEQYSKANEAIYAAIRALEGATPHARDYYVQNDQATAEALKEHRARVEKLLEVRKEINTILEHIADSE